MKSVFSFIMVMMIVIYSVAGIIFWTSILGGVGFIGAIVTYPVSIILYMLYGLFSSVGGFIIHLILIGVGVISASIALEQ